MAVPAGVGLSGRLIHNAAIVYYTEATATTGGDEQSISIGLLIAQLNYRYCMVHSLFKAIDHSMYVSGFSFTSVASISVSSVHGAFWVQTCQMCPTVCTQWTILFLIENRK